MHDKHTFRIAGVYFGVYLAICLLFKGSGYTNEYYVLISVATFLFGIFIAFSIYNHQTRLSRVKELLRTDDAYLLSIYRQTITFGKEAQDKVRSLIDAYLIAQLDYKLADDYHQSAEQFHQFYNFVLELSPKNDKQTAVYQSMLEMVTSSSVNRKLVGTYVRQRMTKVEWISIGSLQILIAYFVFTFNNSGLLSSLLSTLLVTSAFLMVLVLRQLNQLSWQEEEWIWHPMHNLFLDLGLVPYYPDLVIDQARTTVADNTTIRICHYGKPYPDMSNNHIETIVFKAPKTF